MALIHPLKVGQKIYFEWPRDECVDPEFGDYNNFGGLSGKGRILSITTEANGVLIYRIRLTQIDGPEAENFDIGSEVNVTSPDVKRIIEEPN